ncbi:histone H2B type F-M-like isoform X2 [Gorilla gorilla gorilla]|nr:histone H2B type F-M-like isoform X2 [Gorilla gorilla gorilla]
MAEAFSKTTSEEDQSIQEPKEANSMTAQKQKRRGRRGSRRRHANSGGDIFGDSFATYFPRVLKQVHRALSLSQEVVSVMDSMVRDILDRIATEAGHLAHYSKCVTITSRDIRMAVCLLLPGKMGKLAESQGTNATLRTSLCAIWQQRK